MRYISPAIFPFVLASLLPLAFGTRVTTEIKLGDTTPPGTIACDKEKKPYQLIPVLGRHGDERGYVTATEKACEQIMAKLDKKTNVTKKDQSTLVAPVTLAKKKAAGVVHVNIYNPHHVKHKMELQVCKDMLRRISWAKGCYEGFDTIGGNYTLPDDVTYEAYATRPS